MTSEASTWTAQELEDVAAEAGIDLAADGPLSRLVRRINREVAGKTRHEAELILDAYADLTRDRMSREELSR